MTGTSGSEHCELLLVQVATAKLTLSRNPVAPDRGVRFSTSRWSAAAGYHVAAVSLEQVHKAPAT